MRIPTWKEAEKCFKEEMKPVLDQWSRAQYKEHGEHWCSTTDGDDIRPLVCAGIRLNDGKMRAPFAFHCDNYGNIVARIVNQGR